MKIKKETMKIKKKAINIFKKEKKLVVTTGIHSTFQKDIASFL